MDRLTIHHNVAFLLIIPIFLKTCHCNALSLMQGQDANLIFPYPCSSTSVTLQYSYRNPFYISTDESQPSSQKSQEHRYRVELTHDEDSPKECFVNLTISSITRDDQGTYILFVYMDREILGDATQRIWLGVDYPPGEASVIGTEAKGGNWMAVKFTAPVGSIGGKIECYQGGEWMPPLSEPTETDVLLKQTILIRKSHPVFCCSSVFYEEKDICACNDTALYLEPSSSNTPCPTVPRKIPKATTSRYRSPEAVEITLSVTSTNYIQSTSTKSQDASKNIQHNLKIAIIILVIILVIMLTIIAILLFKLRQKRNNNNMESFDAYKLKHCGRDDIQEIVKLRLNSQNTATSP
ncbi:uncharacterized protein LOC121422701 [Lytechinus variegatus]|uniref:uncharacterized protein LOC121422701 n=1 Tax=Lytechinus variegatus TaxID=7654 RepID=UPI001BB1BBFC|nr:uncharacterized protein LOC121422701 [Lytechinus variegatus]